MSVSAGRRPFRRLLRKPQRGFTLIEMAVVLTVAGLTLALGLKSLAAYAGAENRKTTDSRLDAIQDALILFVARNHYLPCPADISLDETEANAGQPTSVPSATCSVSGTYQRGVPWAALGIPPALTYDGWHRRISYYVDVTLTQPTSGYTNGTPTAATADTACGDGNIIQGLDLTAVPLCQTYVCGIYGFLAGKGLEVDNSGSGTPVIGKIAFGQGCNPTTMHNAGGGAAFVLVSHGEDGKGGFLRGTSSSSPLFIASAPAGSDEYINTLPSGLGTGHYVLKPLTGNNPEDATYFDDMLRAPTVHWVISKAGLIPSS